ncbi:PHP domain-containing protein [Desulfolutivibrio sulfoxidireducens]|uniref:PHP domain-containing protein n=1 Tax=Desulfolutivibrio sulfoxidireducens TaxID=2773299 RepID=UPI00159E5A67|nr:PHP domain-containing protein [Desulfolutivibrio sulfoxidireducens]QLA17430.1 PHP domain-containing protein [Desulfolutivibrio sulfoxidireducens]
MPGIDLHTHSTASDGTLSPRELVRLAAASGLSAVAITDHDTVDGLPGAMAAGREFGITVVGGVELSVFDGRRALHLLGLFLPERPGDLGHVLADLREKRHDRNRLILEKLTSMGIALDYDEVLALAGGAVGRPHIAAALMKKGVVTSFKEAFSRLLGPNGQAYVPKKKMSLERAVSLLLAERATPAIAHPFLLRQNGRALERLMAEYKDKGVDAIEALYSEHSDGQTREYLALAAKLDLGVTGGSDFHGAAKPEIRLGVGKGGLVVPDAVLAALLARRKARGETF